MFFSIFLKKGNNKRHTYLNLNKFPNKIKISGNDNKIFNIQNNILSLDKNEMKKLRNSEFYVNLNNKNENKTNLQNYNLFIKKTPSIKSNKNEINLNEMDNFNKGNIKREKSISPQKNCNENSHEILYNLNMKKNLDFTENLNSYNKIKFQNISNSPINSKLMNNKEIIRPELNNFNKDNK